MLNMKNKLFIICPFSHLEPFIINNFGQNSYFLTMPGGLAPSNDYDFLSSINEFLKTYGISSIYLVSDTGCRFVSTIVNHEQPFGLTVEQALQEIYIDHYTKDFKDKDPHLKKQKLAELHIKKQINELKESVVLGPVISQNNIKVNGLLTSKIFNLTKEIN